MAAKVKELNLKNVRKSNLPLVIGYFGCIHVMHAQLLTKHHTFNVLTFKDFPGKQQKQVYKYKQRLANINKFKPQNIFVFDITKNNLTAEEFIKQVLLKIKPSSIVVGTDFKFGSDRKGWQILNKDFELETVQYNKNISTTLIGKLLKSKKIEQANDLMYFPYYYISKWIKGKQQGRTMGIRTINLLIDHDFFLPEGVYATMINIGYNKYKAITFYGKSETFNNKQASLETHVMSKFIFPRALYTPIVRNYIRIQFYKYLRPNTKFKNKEELAQAIKQDIKKAKDYFEQNN